MLKKIMAFDFIPFVLSLSKEIHYVGLDNSFFAWVFVNTSPSFALKRTAQVQLHVLIHPQIMLRTRKGRPK